MKETWEDLGVKMNHSLALTLSLLPTTTCSLSRQLDYRSSSLFLIFFLSFPLLSLLHSYSLEFDSLALSLSFFSHSLSFSLSL